MAHRCTVLVLGLVALAGCQQSRVVRSYPQPNFNGPTVPQQVQVAAPAPTAPLPQVTVPAKDNPAPAAVSLAGIPRDWIPSAQPRPWRYIVIHHSATPAGSVREFDRLHKAKGWDECGYHFVIGNGTETGNGQVEVGPRWGKQKYGAHAKTPDNRFNDFGIGICLVGNFDIERPTPQQSAALSKLVAHLMKTYRIPARSVMGHSDTGRATECPGRNLNVIALRKAVAHSFAEAGKAGDEGLTQTASVELLVDQQE